jgi:hypothetical protein
MKHREIHFHVMRVRAGSVMSSLELTGHILKMVQQDEKIELEVYGASGG